MNVELTNDMTFFVYRCTALPFALSLQLLAYCPERCTLTRVRMIKSTDLHVPHVLFPF